MKSLSLRDYVVIGIECVSDHPKLNIYVPDSEEIPYVIEKGICPCCLATENVRLKRYEGTHELIITDTQRSFRPHYDRSWWGQSREAILYSLRCIGGGELSFIQPKNMSWRDNIKLKACPVCGFDSRASDLKKHDVKIKLDPPIHTAQKDSNIKLRIR